MTPEELEKMSIELMRRTLGSINLQDIEDELAMDEGGKMNRACDAETFWKNHFKKKLTNLIQAQLEFMGMQIEQGQLPFARGTLNGLTLVKEWFEEAIKLSLSRFDKPEEPEAGGSGIPDIGESITGGGSG